jgi:hypothetical protein
VDVQRVSSGWISSTIEKAPPVDSAEARMANYAEIMETFAASSFDFVVPRLRAGRTRRAAVHRCVAAA